MSIREGLWFVPWQPAANARSLIHLALNLTVALARLLFRSRLELLIENLALRKQLAVLNSGT